jgi:biotin carboxyl carrier protein
MAHAYTPGLRVSELTVLRKERRLPIKGEVLVSLGDVVTSDTVIAQTHLPGNVQLINVASKLGIPPEDLPPIMQKAEGDAVRKGEPLATTKGLFGMFKSNVPSPCDGSVENISTVTGQVILREPPTPIQIDAYVDGKVVEVFEEEGVAVEVTGTFIQGIFGVGGEKTGVLTIRTEDPSKPLTADDIRDDDAGRIIVGGSHVTWDGLQKAMQVKAHGVVVGGFDDPDLKRLLGKDLGVAITGHEDVATSLVLTEGFGEIAMAKGTFDLLKKRDGRKASINGATQIRAGVIRPEIVIPIEEALASDVIAAADQGTGLDIGSTIRAIRAPYFGRLGEVTELPNELRKMESESMVRVLKVRFADGEEALLPRANVEMIER